MKDAPHSLQEMLESTPLSCNVLLCVSGSIAAYKSLELASALKKLGANVAVVMSESAKKFISPLSFEAITHIQVLHAGSEQWASTDSTKGVLDSISPIDSSSNAIDINLIDSTPTSRHQAESSSTLKSTSATQSPSSLSVPTACNHIAYAQWASVCIIAPASASSIAKLANGIADTLIIQTLLATSSPILCAPAMNTQMFLSKQTQENLATLERLGIEIIAPRVGLLACDTMGIGALAHIEDILCAILRACRRESFWCGKSVCITGGGASAQIDSVRAITNHSSGLQASALALALYTLGADVQLISSAFPIALPRAITRTQVRTNEDYHRAILQAQSEHRDKKDSTPMVLFMAAALVDFAPTIAQKHKIKKHTTSKLELQLEPCLDVLASLDATHIIKVGFKAEDTISHTNPNHHTQSDTQNKQHNSSQSPIESARKLLLPASEGGKDCTLVCLNTLESKPFGAMENRFLLLNRTNLDPNAPILELPRESKLALSYKIAQFLQETLSQESLETHSAHTTHLTQCYKN